MLTMFHNIDDAAEKLEIAMHSCVAAENNQNLSPSQKEMLRWHFRLGHASMSAMISKKGPKKTTYFCWKKREPSQLGWNSVLLGKYVFMPLLWYIFYLDSL